MCKIPLHRKWVRLKCVLYLRLDALFCFSSLILMRASLKSSSLAKGIKESTLERQLFILYFQFSQGVLFTAVETPLYLYFIAFVVPSKVLIEVSARFWFLHKNRFFISQTFPSPFFPSRPGNYSKKSETFCTWSLYV